TYTATVANAVAQITITPTSNHADASVTIDNTAVARGAGFNKTLSVGVNTIVIRVTAPDERATRDYTLAITRAIPVASNDASLSALSISRGSLAEIFAATTLAYTATLANSISSISVTPTVNQADARVTVAGNSVDSGEESEAIDLPAGVETVIEVVVTAQNADKRTYTLRITREAGKPGLPKNLKVAAGNAKLLVTWEAPDDENGAPVSGYKIRWRIPSGADFGAPVEVSGTAYTILRLAAGNYKVQILAVNLKGDGQYSDSQDGRVHTYSADVDDSGEVNAPDGIMLARYLLGVRGAKLVEAQSGDGNAGKVEENVQHGIALDVLDIDGDGDTDGNDGILLARYFAGLRGEALIANLGLEQDALAGVLAKLRGLTP
ncbi:MAG: cadherin-like beta sandwich domain-containing protein, partial [Gammaproteobacteria bacterium]